MVSPMQAITFTSLDTAYAHLAATSASVSPFCRRSECPTSVHRTPMSASMSADVSPVYAPAPACHTSCAAAATSPRRVSLTLAR